MYDSTSYRIVIYFDDNRITLTLTLKINNFRKNCLEKFLG
jgi:hypothetical protein